MSYNPYSNGERGWAVRFADGERVYVSATSPTTAKQKAEREYGKEVIGIMCYN